MAKKLIYFTAQYQGCIEVDVDDDQDCQDVLEDQTHSALFDACETDISLEIINYDEED